MELSVKQWLRQGTRPAKFLFGTLVGWGTVCSVAEANSLPQELYGLTSVDAMTGGEVPQNVETFTGTSLYQAQVSPPTIDTPPLTPEFTPNSPPNDPSEEVIPLTSVDQLSDVKPTDWAYQALRSLMERYGVISGFTDGTFRGKRPLTRYQFAAAINAVAQQIDQQLVNTVREQFIEEDARTLQRLEEEFRPALEELRTRIKDIDNRTAQLEAHQFSTTTKLQGEVVAASTGGSNAGSTIISRARLTLSTSFKGPDRLVTQLESGNDGGDAISKIQDENPNLLGTEGLIGNAGGLDYALVDNNLQIRRLYYQFTPQSDLLVTIGAKMLPRDFIDRNQYANNEAVHFSSGFFVNNPLIIQNQIDREGGAGGAIAWNPGGGKLTLRSLYIAADSNQTTQQRTEGGLFGDRYQGSVEVEYLPSNKLALRLQYTHALINNTTINAYGINSEYALNRTTAVFGRLGFGSYTGFNTVLSRNLDLNPYSWAIGATLRNFFVPGTLAGLAIGQPFVTGDLGNATQTNFEAFYNLQLSDNISITPVISLVRNANNDSANGSTWQATVRTSFDF